MPGLVQASLANRAVARIGPTEPEVGWADAFKAPDPRGHRAETVARAYSDAITRGLRVEAKAVGLLQVVAIGFAVIALVAQQDGWILRVLATISLVYLTLSTLGLARVLKVRPRRQVLVRDSLTSSGGLAETAEAAEDLERQHLETSNFMSGATRDLLVGGAVALASLAAVVWGAR